MSKLTRDQMDAKNAAARVRYWRIRAADDNEVRRAMATGQRAIRQRVGAQSRWTLSSRPEKLLRQELFEAMFEAGHSLSMGPADDEDLYTLARP